MRPPGGGRRLAAVSPSTLQKRPPRAVAPEAFEDVGRVIAVLGGVDVKVKKLPLKKRLLPD